MSFPISYLGLNLRSPLVASASPLTKTLDNLRKMEDAGLGAVVLYSLFQEQINYEPDELDHFLSTNGQADARWDPTYPIRSNDFKGPDDYLEYIARAKKAVNIPIIASLNGRSLSSWVLLARSLAEAGADALELNIYSVPTDLALTGEQVEKNLLEIVRAVRANVDLPIAVKMSPYFSSPANLAFQLSQEKVDGLVLFNRFYQPDIDLETLRVQPNILLSTAHSSRLPLRWISILKGRVKTSLAASGGVLTGREAAKMILAGADVVQLCSTLMRHGIGYAQQIQRDLEEWMEELGYENYTQMCGCLSQQNMENPELFERAQYLRALQTLDPLKS